MSREHEAWAPIESRSGFRKHRPLRSLQMDEDMKGIAQGSELLQKAVPNAKYERLVILIGFGNELVPLECRMSAVSSIDNGAILKEAFEDAAKSL